MKKQIYLKVIILFAVLFHSNVALANKSPDKPYENFWGDLDYIEKIKVDTEGHSVYHKSNWVPIRKLFSKNVQDIIWDNTVKVAKIKNNGKELVFIFSDKEIEFNENQYIVPKQYSKFADDITYIDVYWLAYTFDKYADYAVDWEDPERDNLKEKLNFLGIIYIDYIPSVKDKTFHMFIKWDQ